MIGKGQIVVGNVIVKESVYKTYWACDYEKCKGHCCYAEDSGGYMYTGAPLTDQEASSIVLQAHKIIPFMDRRFVPKDPKDLVQKDPRWYETGLLDNYCRFCTEGGCALDKMGKKPISCWLAPIVEQNTLKGTVLYAVDYLLEADHCKPAREKGEKEGILLHEFCQDALVKRFGSEWYALLLSKIHDLENNI